MVPTIYTQDSFAGGMDLLSQDTQIASNKYRVGLNVRTRFGDVRPIRAPVEMMDGLPAIVKMQGLYSFGSIIILFADGLAYYWLVDSSTEWTNIPDFLMDSGVDRIWACLVPQSHMNYNRVATTANPSEAVTITSETVTGTPSALVVQDGTNQPWVIFEDGTARVANTYAQWDVNNREYVPVGRQMVHFNGILFVVSADGKKIFRSVSGRPLDFVIAINTTTGNKVANADGLAHAVDANEIKMIAALNANSLIVITSYAAYAVTLRFTSTLYGEPTFNNQLLFSAGVVNQFSFTDVLGDFAFIDREGLKSFNAVSQLTFEGNNSVFSLSVAELFKNIVQTDPCVGSFDNYTLFSVRTTYSDNSVLIYDNVQKLFVGIDIMTNQAIKQFASSYTASEQRLFCISKKKVYELYSEDSTFMTGFLFTRAFDSKNTDAGATPTIDQVKSKSVRLIFQESRNSGLMNVSEFVDDVVGDQYEREITSYDQAIYIPVTIPVTAGMKRSVNNIIVPIKGRMGSKLSFVIGWTEGSKLSKFQLEAWTNQVPVARGQRDSIYA